MLKKLLWLALATTLPKFASAAEVGLLVAVKGNVQTFRPAKNKWSKASAMESVADGGKIKVEPNGEATIALFKNGARYQLAPGSVTLVAPDSCKTASGPAAKALPAVALRQIKDLAHSRIATGRPGGTVIRGGPHDIELQSLSNTAILARPVFKWRSVDGAASYKLKIWDEKDEQIWQSEVFASTATYPADAPHLKAGIDYIWRVSAMVNGVRFDANGIFRVLTADEQTVVTEEIKTLAAEGDQALNQVLRVEVYARHSLWDDAIAAYESLAAAYPESAAVHGTLANLYNEQGRYAQSRAEQQLAEQNDL